MQQPQNCRPYQRRPFKRALVRAPRAPRPSGRCRVRSHEGRHPRTIDQTFKDDSLTLAWLVCRFRLVLLTTVQAFVELVLLSLPQRNSRTFSNLQVTAISDRELNGWRASRHRATLWMRTLCHFDCRTAGEPIPQIRRSAFS